MTTRLTLTFLKVSTLMRRATDNMSAESGPRPTWPAMRVVTPGSDR